MPSGAGVNEWYLPVPFGEFDYDEDDSKGCSRHDSQREEVTRGDVVHDVGRYSGEHSGEDDHGRAIPDS